MYLRFASSQSMRERERYTFQTVTAKLYLGKHKTAPLDVSLNQDHDQDVLLATHVRTYVRTGVAVLGPKGEELVVTKDCSEKCIYNTHV